MKLPFSLTVDQCHRSIKPLLRYPLLALSTTIAFPNIGYSQELEEVVVTGSYLSKIRQSDVPSPTTVLGETYLDDIGAANIADLVQSLTINNGSQNNPDAFTQNATTGTSNFNLRGLGVASH